MRFPDDAPVQPQKLEELRKRLAQLGIALAGVDEQAVRSRGPGGQKVNKTSSGVLLRCRIGTEQIVVKWTRERQHALNRFLALRELVDQIELRISPATSERLRDITRKRRQKDRLRRRRAARQETSD
jgi:protein subunit release factor B